MLKLKEEEQYYCDRLSKMIQCKTVSVKGEFHPEEFQKLREIVKELFPILSQKAEIKYFGDDCYVYKLHGKNSEKNVMLMSHHDVVPAEGEWKYPPFSGICAEGCIWGRGTVDTKTPLFAEMSALEELLQEQWTPPCNVYLVSSHNEEIAGDGVPLALKWFEEEKITFDWILDEGGAVIDPPMNGIRGKCAMLAVHEKGRTSVRMIAKQGGGHGSLSKEQKSPIVRMASFITKMESEQPFLRKMPKEVLEMFRSLTPAMNFPMCMIFSNVDCLQGVLKKIIPTLNASAGAMLGTTCSFKNIQTMENGDCTVEAFFRCINEEDLEKDIRTFLQIAKNDDIVYEKTLDHEFHKPANLKSEGYTFIKSCVEETFPYATCAPFILPAGTDARHFSHLSDAVIRFAPIDIDQQQYGSVHNVNENICMESVVKAVHFYKELLKKIRN